jgi:predicted phosphodiesterase
MAVTEERVADVVEHYLLHGEESTLKTFSINAESLYRYTRAYKQKQDSFGLNATLAKIRDTYSESELRAIANGGRITPGFNRVPIIDFDGDVVTLGVIGDTHIGSQYFVDHWLDVAFETFADNNVSHVMHVGDVVEGMSHRPGHIYELDELGYDAQLSKAVKVLSVWDGPMYFIDGNHDRWYIKNGNAGALIVKALCEAIPNATFLGHDEGNVSVNGAVIKLWHGEDFSSYASSYRVQKLIEAFQPGEKPNVLLCGHTHKQLYMYARSIHAISCGALSMQSHFMRSKRMENHSGFWVVRMCIGDGSVKWL